MTCNELSKKEQITFSVLIIFCFIVVSFSIGTIQGRVWGCIENNGILDFDNKCVVPKGNISICTINGVPYTIDEDLEIRPEIRFNLTLNNTPIKN